MAQGVHGRALIVDYFNRQIPLRRERGGSDLFSQLCRATWEDGSLLSAADIADHMSFLMMAAHDTLTSSLTSFVYRLAANPAWQERVREEVLALKEDLALKHAADEPLPFLFWAAQVRSSLQKSASPTRDRSAARVIAPPL